LEAVDLSGLVGSLDWVICGGETGPGARVLNDDWARLLRDQAGAAGVPFFFKQRNRKGDNVLDGKRHQQYPEG
jgi:protein gp37